MDIDIGKTEKLKVTGLATGSRIAENYEIVEELGSGAWGTVYKARHVALSRNLAIKILHAHLVNNPEKLQRFRQEAEAVSRLSHRGFVTLYDYGVLPDGSPYIAMELLEGKNLEVIFQERSLAADELLNLFHQVATALAAAHVHKIIHRDVKPSNILIVENAEGLTAKLVDFGLAKLVDENAQITGTGETLGTPAYMSPEQCYGLPLDARSDIYSLGCLMYEAFTHKRVAEGATIFECMKAHIEDCPPRFSKVMDKDAEIPGLENVVFRAIAKDPDDRYQTADEMAADIQAVIDGGGKRIKPYANRVRGNSRTKIVNPSVIAIAIASVFLLSIALLIVSRGNYSTPDQDATIDKLDNDFERAIGSHDFPAAERLLLRAKEKSLVSFGRLSEPYRWQLKKLRELYTVSKQRDKLAAIEAELSYVDADFKYGTLDGNAQQILKLTLAINSGKATEENYRQILKVMNDQAVLLSQAQKFHEAEELLQQGLALKGKLSGDTLDVARTYNNLAWVHQNLGESALAEKESQEAIAVAAKLGQAETALGGKFMGNLAGIYSNQRRYDLAEKQLMSIRDMYIRKFGADSLLRARCETSLASVNLLQNKTQAALDHLRIAVPLQEKAYQGSHPDLADTFYDIGLAQSRLGQHTEAESCFKRALAIYEREYGPKNASVAMVLFQLATEYQNQGRIADAKPLFTRAKSIRENMSVGAITRLSPEH